MRSDWRVIKSGPYDAKTNMAIDGRILSEYLADGIPRFRIYSWSAPSITFGVSQKPEEVLDLERCGAEKIQYVKRMTGGGVIFHDDELTYSLACSKDDIGPSDGTVAGSFKAICAFLIEFYERLGLAPGFAVDRAPGEKIGAFSDFCFASKEKYDIVIAGKKMGGNAQKRTRQAIFQHGSIPVSFDRRRAASLVKDKDGAAGCGAASLEELLGRRPEREELTELLGGAFAKTFMAQQEDQPLGMR